MHCCPRVLQLVKWLGLDPSVARLKRSFKPVHKREYKASLPRDFVEELVAFHEPYNQLLFEVLERHGFSQHAAQLRHDWADPAGALVARHG